MKNQYRQLALILLGFILLACEKEETKLNILSLSINNVPSNTLIKNISFTTNYATEACIEYWKYLDKSDIKTTLTTQKSCQHTIPVILLEPDSDYSFTIVDKKTGQRSTAVYNLNTPKIDKDITDFFSEINLNVKIDGYILFSDQYNDYHIMLNNKGKIVWYNQFFPKGCLSSSFDMKDNYISFLHGREAEQFCGTNISSYDLYGNEIFSFDNTELKSPLLHHDVIRLSNGDWIYPSFMDREVDFSPLGINEVRNVRGDGLVIIDRFGKEKWRWEGLDHIDPLKDSDILSEDGAFGLLPVTGDFFHINAIAEDESGNLYFSSNRLEEFWKIDRNTGDVIYCLGKNGNIAIPSGAIPQFMHSISLYKDEVMIFENGYSERGYSRILAYKVDEKSKSAILSREIKLDEEYFSLRNGSVYVINDDYLLVNSTRAKTSLILDNTGKILSEIKMTRPSFRATYIPRIDL